MSPLTLSSYSTTASMSKTCLMFSLVRMSAVGPASTMTPCSIRMISSQYLAANIRSWVTMIVMMSLFSLRSVMRSIRSNWWFTSRCSVGSSRRRTLGSWARARAIITLRISPPLSSFTLRSANSRAPALSMASRTALRSFSLSPVRRE